jgi:hypothetical protein
MNENPNTQHHIQKVFTNAKHHPELKLTDNIWQVIVAREEHKVRLRMWKYILTGFVSLTLLVPTAITFGRQLSESGFFEYVSLGFSDSVSIAFNWKEFALTLADALPATSLFLALTLAVIFLICLRRAARYIRSSLLAV